MIPQVSKPSELSSGVYSGDVNLFSGDYNSTIQLGSVSTPSGLSFALSLNYSSSFSIGNTMPVSTGIPYGEGWNLNIPTISIETEVFNNFKLDDYCTESGTSSTLLNFSSVGNRVVNEGDVYWFSPYINIPGVASGRAVFKYIDVDDNKTAVFELNAFENHVEIRYTGDSWIVITADGTRYTFRTAVQSYNAPSNKRVLYYDQAHTNTGVNDAEDVQVLGDYENAGQAAAIENSILPKQKYNLWYCDAITHRNQPFQGINFTYKGFGKFNYFKEFDQEAYKYAAAAKFSSSTFAKEHDFSCYADLLLMKVEAISIDGLVDRLELNYATDKNLILNNNNEFINFTANGNGRLDSLYSYQSIFSDGKSDDVFNSEWKRYQHSKINGTTNPNAINPSDPYSTSGGYLRSNTGDSSSISFAHSFIESPRLMTDKIYPGDIYEVRSRITRPNGESEPQIFQNAGTFDMRIVTGDLENPRGLDSLNADFSEYNLNNGIYFSTDNYNSSRSKVLYSTFNMALKWSLNYGESNKQLSNLFVMPNIPTKYQGFNFQIGPGNSDMNYSLLPTEVWDFNTTDSIYELMTENAYICRYGEPLSFALKSAADIPGNFGIGLPWNMVSPIYEHMITHENPLNYASGSGKEAYHFWWNFMNTSLTGALPSTSNTPTKLDATVKLEDFELIRYTKNPYMLVGVNYFKVNGEIGGPVETGLKLINRKKLEYTSDTCRMLQNYAYNNGDPLQYRNDVKQVFVLLKAVREIPIGWTSDTTQLLTTFFSYSKFKNNQATYQSDQLLNGHTGMVLTQIVDNLGGITKIEYYPTSDPRTRFTGAFSRENSGFCGVVATTGYGLSRSDVVHPIVKYVLKNDEDDLVKNGTSSTNNGHKRWFYDFKTDSMVKKSTLIQISDKRFYNGRRFNFDVGFKKVSVYGPSLMEDGNEYVNRTDYVHYGGDFDYQVTFPSAEDYLYHGKLKSVKEYDVNNKLFSEKLISYEYTLAYQNGYTRPNPYREDLVWEQEYDNPGGQYEYRDYYLNKPVSVTIGSGPGITYTGSAAYPWLDIPVFNGSGSDFELPKFLEFEFFPVLDTANPAYMFHSYFIKKKEEINRKYDNYLYKQAIISSGTLPAPYVYTGANPFGPGHTNPRVYNATLATAQISLINTATASAIVDTLLTHSPIMDTVLYHVMYTTRISDQQKMTLLLAQGNLSNLTLIRFMGKFGTNLLFTSISPISVINQQSYIADEVLLSAAQNTSIRWSSDFIETLFLKNEYLSDPVVKALADGTSRYFGTNSFLKILTNQPQFSESAITKIVNSRYLTPATLRNILMSQVITDANFSTIIGKSAISNNTIVEIIETGNKYPSETVFNALMARSPAFTESEMERIIAVANRDIEPAVLSSLIAIYGSKPFLTGFAFTGNPLDVYCNNAAQSNWSYIETKTTYEYYEADYKGTSNGRAYKALMGLEDIPGRTVSSTDIFGTGGTKTINSLRLKHEPSWQVFSITNTSPHLPTAKDEKQYFYLYDLKNRYDRYWYNYDIKTINGVGTQFDHVLLNDDQDTVMYSFRWDPDYVDTYTAGIAPELPKYDGMTRSRQYAMRSTPFQQTHITKNQRDAAELRKSEYYLYDARWPVDAFSTNQTVEYDGPSCPEIGTPPVDPVSCASCVRWKNGTEEEFLAQLPFNYCLWKDPVVGYYACPSTINYATCYPGVELIGCNPAIPTGDDEEGGPAELPILTDVLKKTLQLRSTITQLDTIMDAVSTAFSTKRFDRSNTQVADFYVDYAGVDANGFIHPFKMLFPFDTLTTSRVHKRNQHMQPTLISNQVGLLTKFYYNTTKINWNVDTNCTNPHFSFLYNYSSVETRNIGLPIHVTVGYGRADSLGTSFEYTDDGQVSKMIAPSGHYMEYAFDGFNRLKNITENGTRLLSRNEYQLWKHNFSRTFKERTDENYVYSVLYQNNTDTADYREFQKAFIDPLGRKAGIVKAYRDEGTIQISSGSVDYDNWGRPKIQRKPSVFYDSIPVTALNPILYKYNLASPLYNETKYENDPGSLDIRHSDPGISITDSTTMKKQTWITNNIYMSCELGLSRTELNLIMNSGATGSFRFTRTSVKDQDNKETVTYTNATGQTVATMAMANTTEKVVTLYVYDSYGNLSKTINALRQHTNYQYNLLGQLIRETNVDGGEKRYIYNKHGKISAVQDEADRRHVDTHDALEPRYRKFEYDSYGNLISQSLVTNPYHIDPFCFETKAVGAPGNYEYDINSLPHYFHYTFSNRMTQDWLIRYKTLDPFDEDTMSIAGMPNIPSFTTVISEKTMIYGTSQLTPSSLGKLIESNSYGPSLGAYANSIQKITYTYNSEDLLASQVILQHPTNVATNDQFLVKVTITYALYNFRGALLEQKLDMGSNGSVDMKYFYEYDQLNRLQKVFAAQGDVSTANDGTAICSYVYDNARGTVISKRFHGETGTPAQVMPYFYDDRDRLTGIGNSNTLFWEQLYYDATAMPSYNNSTVGQQNTFNGNVKGTKISYNFSTASNSVPLFSKETIYGYKYDRINRLVQADGLVGDIVDAQFGNTSNVNPGTSYGIGDEVWKYDRIGNILIQNRTKPAANVNNSSTQEDFSYTYFNGNNRLKKVEDLVSSAARNYTYDENGNLLTDDHRDINATVYLRGTYPYQVEQDSTDSYYLYDGSDQRIFKKVVGSGQTTREMYIKDATGRDLSIVKFTTTGSTTTSSSEYFVYGSDRVARITASTTTPAAKIHPAEATYFIYDHLGNTRVAFMVDSINIPLIVNALDYYSYGKILREYDNGSGDRYLTTQHERDKETGLDYRGARYYDSDVARFLSLDPKVSKYPSLSPYNYVAGNPIILIDPNGKDHVVSSTLTKNTDNKTYTMNTRVTATYYIVDATKNKLASGISPQLGSGYTERLNDGGPKKVNGKNVTNTTVSIEISFKYVESISSIPSGANVLFIVDGAKGEQGKNMLGWGEIGGNKALAEYTKNFNTLKSVIIHEIGHNLGMDHEPGGAMEETNTGKTSFGKNTIKQQTNWFHNVNTGVYPQQFGTGNSNADIKSFLDNYTSSSYNTAAIKK
ncbi:RHS repeat-associated core domain-containing protein [Fluviicola sp.]|uniref:RHS repeat domain-containing protein n=1 Tax=Fluviicola sp. TaxID=1917219 RepID=UPI0031D64981